MRFFISAIFLCFSSSLMQAHADSIKRTALVIGNARYEAEAGSLKNTVNDAKAMAATLKSLGFQVIERQNVTRDQLIKAVLDFRTTLAGKEVGLFYYAGHGLSIGGANYILPIKSGYSAQGADDATLRMLAETRLFNIEQAVADMKSAGAHCNLVILDACRNTALAKTGRTRDVAESGGLVEMKPPAGSLIAFATDAGQTALDGDGSNGLYTGELLKHLKTPGINIEQVFKRTRAGVLEGSEGKQIPAEYSRLIGEDIYLAGPSTSAATEPAMVKAEAISVPTLAMIQKLAKGGKREECLQNLNERVAAEGASADFAEIISSLLDFAKNDLKEATTTSPKIEATALLCQRLSELLPDSLPRDHLRYNELLAKAHNRQGDALLIVGRADDALDVYNLAQQLAPDDAYILCNRGRAFLALGDKASAKADFTRATDPKFDQPKARALAEKALAEMT